MSVNYNSYAISMQVHSSSQDINNHRWWLYSNHFYVKDGKGGFVKNLDLMQATIIQLCVNLNHAIVFKDIYIQ